MTSEVASTVLGDATEFSISLFVKLSASISSSVTLFKCRNTGSTNNQISLIYHASGNEFRFSSKFSGSNDVANGGTTNANGASYEGDGIWHHLVGSVSATSNTTKLWIDGALKESVNGIGTLNESTNAVSLLSNGANGSFWDGDVKDVAIYKRELNEEEVGVIYNSRGTAGDRGRDLVSGSHVSNTGLMAHFRFEDDSGTTRAVNQAGVDGTYVNAPTITTNIP